MAQKRKAQHSQPTPNSYKKPRTENGSQTCNSASAHQSTVLQISDSLPAMPQITPALEKAVFTHQGIAPVASSHSYAATGPLPELTYDRLEFLGDAYIEVMATRLIWGSYNALPAGRMSQIRELLVKNETLHEYAVLYSFDRRLQAPEHLQREDAKRWLKVVADVFEAYVAAVVLSDPVHGFRAAEEWLVALWQGKLKDVKAAGPNLRAKEELARKVMAKGIKLHYRDEAPMEVLKGGMQTYFIGVYLTGWGWKDLPLGSGAGLSKVAAGNEAAARALENSEMIAEITERRTKFLEEQRAERERIEAMKDGVDKNPD